MAIMGILGKLKKKKKNKHTPKKVRQNPLTLRSDNMQSCFAAMLNSIRQQYLTFISSYPDTNANGFAQSAKVKDDSFNSRAISLAIVGQGSCNNQRKIIAASLELHALHAHDFIDISTTLILDALSVVAEFLNQDDEVLVDHTYQQL